MGPGLPPLVMLAALLVSLPQADESAAGGLQLSPAEVALALEFSPLPPPPADPTNSWADDPAAARLGRSLFFDPRLSGPGTVSCSTCHLPDQGWGDGRALAHGVADHTRHSMTLWNVAYNRWFFWDGRKDTLWGQALEPLEDPREHQSSRLAVLHVIASDPDYTRAYTELFGPLPALHDSERFPAQGRPVPDDDEHPHAVAWNAMAPGDQAAADRAYANLGKSIAAFERAIVSRPAPFDVFVEGLRQGDSAKLAALSASAQRGFSLFVGKGQCFLCHDGPGFSDGEFHGNRIPLGPVRDPGRALGIEKLRRDPFNSLSEHADDGGRSGRIKLSLAPRGFHIPGDFKTPGLRNVAVTAPYMHDGQMASLEEVVAFYSSLENAAAPDPTGERLIEARNFSAGEQADLLAFLRALTNEHLPAELTSAPETPWMPVAQR